MCRQFSSFFLSPVRPGSNAAVKVLRKPGKRQCWYRDKHSNPKGQDIRDHVTITKIVKKLINDESSNDAQSSADIDRFGMSHCTRECESKAERKRSREREKEDKEKKTCFWYVPSTTITTI